ncbi:MAG: malonyl-[acyl-carrier protein] O-methyltransferase BioC [Gammaproteobacteria bacterium]|nr:MAG: malonyl-[acyl-carrier protein] O-methyltransferase BioC [Gammaproteobacteria bacterium]
MSDVTANLLLDKRSLRASFERAATSYDEAAVLQRAIADRMLERLDVVKLVPASVLDIGSGTGYVARALMRRYPHARLHAADLAHAMVRQARTHTRWRRWLARTPGAFVCADLECLPFAGASFNMIVSNLTLQWCDPVTVFAECRRALHPGGLFMFTTFGPDTLAELRAAWHAVDERPHVHGFPDMHDLGDLLVRAGFAEPVMDVERFTLTYADVLDVLRDLKRLGAHNAAHGRARGLTGKTSFRRFKQAYEAMRVDGRIPATYEAVYGLAWAPETAPQRAADGAMAIPLADIRRKPR